MSPAAQSVGIGAQTGRPALWTKSYQRKMARLYLYTTLPLTKILQVVHHGSPMTAPGTDSANKNLNNLLDKEPRWLHPRTHADMGRRVQQLALSPSRMNEAMPTRAASNPPVLSLHPVQIKAEGGVSPTLLSVPPTTMGPWSAPATPAASHAGSVGWQPTPPRAMDPDEAKDKEMFEPFLRRATVASWSTDTSSSSLREVLAEYSPSYRGVVKGLIRRFTGISPGRNMSPISEANSAVMDWLEDEVAPIQYQGRPYPLPGDFLNLDSHAQCTRTQKHGYRQCLCPAAEELSHTPAGSLPWVTSAGLTSYGIRILSGEIQQRDTPIIDAFGNNILHFIAARGDANLLRNLVFWPQLPPESLHKVNAAGQTFLHVMNRSIMAQTGIVLNILGKLMTTEVDVYAQDHYGRNVFHMLRDGGFGQDVLNHMPVPHETVRWNTRDAFGEMPRPSAPPMAPSLSTHSMDLDDPFQPNENVAIGTHTQILTFINTVLLTPNPALEDSQGRNGLHCLATANLSLATPSASLTVGGATIVAAPVGTTASDGRRRTSGEKKESDSSEARMKLRLSLLKQLVDSGVCPNSYDHHGNTPLMAFAAQLPEDGHHKLGPEMLQTLIKRGASLHARNRAGETALHIAVRCGRKLAVRTLVEAGASVHVRDAMGRSVLDVADAKILAASEDCPQEYARLEACRAWLSGQKGTAVQCPTVVAEWGQRS